MPGIVKLLSVFGYNVFYLLDVGNVMGKGEELTTFLRIITLTYLIPDGFIDVCQWVSITTICE